MKRLLALSATLLLAPAILAPLLAPAQAPQFRDCRVPDIPEVDFRSLSARAIDCQNAQGRAVQLARHDKPDGYSCSKRVSGADVSWSCTSEGQKAYKTSYRKVTG